MAVFQSHLSVVRNSPTGMKNQTSRTGKTKYGSRFVRLETYGPAPVTVGFPTGTTGLNVRRKALGLLGELDLTLNVKLNLRKLMLNVRNVLSGVSL
jgi:hypothetical protein